jgi:uracil-DNA glycosylase
MATVKQIEQHLADVRNCVQCPRMIGPVVTPTAVVSKVYLAGQAPGPHEGRLGKPFAWTAGKTLFRWFGTIGIDEDDFRHRAFMAAICRCFPGKSKQGGDRVPSPDEVTACSTWMQREIELLRPELVIPVGRLAIEQFLPVAPLTDSIGKQFRTSKFGHEFDLIPLPHPSGASTWFKREPGKTLLTEALQTIEAHPAWQAILKPTL